VTLQADAADAAEISEGPGAGVARGAALLFCTPALLRDPAAVESLARDQPQPRVTLLGVTLPGDLGAAPDSGEAALSRLREEAGLRAAARARRTALPADWRADFRGPRLEAARRAQAALGLGATLPVRPDAGARAIAFVLPLLTEGGVERVVLNQAMVLKRQGWRTHLLALGLPAPARLPPALRDAFDSITLAGSMGRAEAEAPVRYLGAATAEFSEHPEAADAAGLLAACDVVVNTHCLAAHALMARLRRAGTRCYVGLHLVERQRWGEPVGNPHVALGYEHAYDGALVVSAGLAAWCAAQGWPRGKLHVIPNAPGHAVPPAAVADALAARAARRGGPLRALFLGRLDAQKGADRLARLIAATRGRVTWRVVGRPVLAQEEAIPAFAVEAEPWVSDPAALTALYAWADVLCLPSRFEGVPLTVLEAQRMGCVVIATDAGETSEAIASGENGFLVQQRGRSEDAILAELASLLDRLADDPGLLLGVGGRAATQAATLDWDRTMAGFLAHLDTVVPQR
jgi:glycosyltransferase involved in cell wall biosynthesis